MSTNGWSATVVTSNACPSLKTDTPRATAILPQPLHGYVRVRACACVCNVRGCARRVLCARASATAVAAAAAVLCVGMGVHRRDRHRLGRWPRAGGGPRTVVWQVTRARRQKTSAGTRRSGSGRRTQRPLLLLLRKLGSKRGADLRRQTSSQTNDQHACAALVPKDSSRSTQRKRAEPVSPVRIGHSPRGTASTAGDIPLALHPPMLGQSGRSAPSV
jgi:hypothetical protein